MQSMQSMQTRQAMALHVQTALCMSRRQPEMKKVCFPSTNHTWESMQSMPCSPCHAVHAMQSMQTMLKSQVARAEHVPRACTMSQPDIPCPKGIYHIQRPDIESIEHIPYPGPKNVEKLTFPELTVHHWDVFPDHR